ILRSAQCLNPASNSRIATSWRRSVTLSPRWKIPPTRADARSHGPPFSLVFCGDDLLGLIGRPWLALIGLLAIFVPASAERSFEVVLHSLGAWCGACVAPGA